MLKNSQTYLRICLTFVFLSLFLNLIVYGQRIDSEISNPVKNQSEYFKEVVDSLEKLKIGGVEQTILIKGESSQNPILLLLHGGPGFPEMPFFRTHNSILEKYFTVVNWDQRGAGLSYSPNIPKESMNVDQFVTDAHELISALKTRFKKDKVFLLGHSWGSLLGVKLIQKYPQDFMAYVGVGQLVNGMDNERVALDFTLEKAIRDKNEKAINVLKTLKKRYPQKNQQAVKDLGVLREWLAYYGGVIYGEKNYSNLFKSVTAKENELYNDVPYAAAEEFSLNNLWGEIIEIDFIKTAPKLDVPVYFFTGRHDYNTSFELTNKYYKVLKAPHKEIIWFENSAHMMPFEEPAKFNDLMINKVLKNSR